MRFELQEKEQRIECTGDHIKEVFEVRDGRGVMRVLRQPGLSRDDLLSMRERRLS